MVRLLLIAALAVPVVACTRSVEQDADLDAWCARMEAWSVAFQDVAPRYDEDPGAVTEEELAHLGETMTELAAAQPPEPIEGEWAVMMGDVDPNGDPLLAEDEFFDAVRAVSAYAEDECGIEFDEELFG